ncbi:MAG TPA: aspartyl protease family protein [Lacipirellulaceae bacterium]|nr:aspartyl protease family protein [Lacipirellulaceae bacterium]
MRAFVVVTLLVSWILLLETVGAGCAEPPAGGLPKLPPPVLEEFTIARNGNLITVPVATLGKTLQFLVDTGFSTSCFNARYRAALGERLRVVRVATPTGEVFFDRYRSKVMTLGRLELRQDFETSCVDLSDAEHVTGRRVDGILGMDALQDLVVNIDFDAGKLRILAYADEGAGHAIPLRWHEKRHFHEGPFALVKIGNESPREFLVDTGAIAHNAGSLDGDAFDEMSRKGVISVLRGVYGAGSLGEPIQTRVARAPRVSIGGFTHRDMLFERLPSERSISLSFLARYLVTLDFPKSTMYLRPGKAFNRLDRRQLTTIELERVADEIRVRKGRVAHPGELGELRHGDAILSVDGADARSMSIYDVEEFLSLPGAHKLMVKDSGGVRQVTLVLLPRPEEIASPKTPPARDKIPQWLGADKRGAAKRDRSKFDD